MSDIEHPKSAPADRATAGPFDESEVNPVRPYVDRAIHDDALHDNLKEAFKAARDVYAELLGNRNLTSTAMRAATDLRSLTCPARLATTASC